MHPALCYYFQNRRLKSTGGIRDKILHGQEENNAFGVLSLLFFYLKKKQQQKPIKT